MGRFPAILTYGLRAGKAAGGNSGRPYPPILQPVQDERMALSRSEVRDGQKVAAPG